jgi:hypothetical protein
MPHTLLDQMACEAGRAAARIFTQHTQRRVPLYGLMQLTRACGDAFSGIDTRRAQLGDQLELLTTLDGDVPPDGYAKLDLECQRRQGKINELEKQVDLLEKALIFEESALCIVRDRQSGRLAPDDLEKAIAHVSGALSRLNTMKAEQTR